MKILTYICIIVPLLTVPACDESARPNPAKQPAIEVDSAAYIGPHQALIDAYAQYGFTTERQWDSIFNITRHIPPSGNAVRDPRYKVFGWHIFAKGSAYLSYNFDLLWGVAYFSYVVDPQTGGYKTIHQWKTTALVDSAHAHGTKVFLTVSNFGAAHNAALLGNAKARRTLADSLITLLRLRSADGVNIDFEGVPGARRDDFSATLIELAAALKAADSSWAITLALYAVDHHNVFDIDAIVEHIDYFTLMGYDYYGGFSAKAGPVAPLHSSKQWGVASLERSIDTYLAAGIPPQKLIVGLPYYGAEWRTSTTKVAARAVRFISHPPYDFIRHKYIDSLDAQYVFDEDGSTQWYVFRDDRNHIRQLWFDDSYSLAVKYDLLKKKGVAGVGIWALGYDHGYGELWELLGDKFGKISK